MMKVCYLVWTPIRVDQNTLWVERGKFARVCVEIDLTKPVVGKIWLNGHWYQVQYEGLHLICASCGCYGHLARNCEKNQAYKPADASIAIVSGADAAGPPPNPFRLLQNVDAIKNDQVNSSRANPVSQPVVQYDLEKDIHGGWMTVTRKKKPPRNQNRKDANNGFEGLRNVIDQSNEEIARNKMVQVPTREGK